ncbi:bifunctional diguanylate cyclase/phosphodiesterase [Gorillibacterium massiliense]|uniref:sensor domain-containing protein n=1 Tax=Gorillibacterium massiliense TaxID=1280390 RepID=UPI0004B377A9|nr:diguanylate cyclase [Gorillibacterium massiliense]
MDKCAAANEALGDTLAVLSKLIRSIPEAVILLGVEPVGFRYLQANDIAMRITGMSQDWLGKRLEEIHSMEEASQIEDHCRKAEASGTPLPYVGLFPPGGKIGKAVCTFCPIPNRHGICKHMMVIARFPETPETVGEEDEELPRVKHYFKNMSELITRIDCEWRIQYASLSYRAVLGWSPADMIGEDILGYVHPEDRPQVMAKLRRLMATQETMSVDYRHRNRDGAWQWMEVKGMLTPAEDGPWSILWVSRDITERRRWEERLSQLVYFDEGTGAANLQLFRDRLEQAIRVARRHRRSFVLFYLNLDDFRLINREYGYEYGDGVMQAIVYRLQDYVGDSGTLGRLSGDEFLILLEDVAFTSEAAETGDKLLRELSRPLIVEDVAHEVMGSLGAALFPLQARHGVALIECAQAAMYQAKEQGKSRCQVYEPPVVN